MAYALMTLSKAIDLLLPQHEEYTFLCDQEQMQFLKAKLNQLQEFLEDVSRRPSSRTPLEVMESRITETAYQLEDIVESILIGSFRQDSASESTPARKSFYQAFAKKTEPYCGTSAASIPVQEEASGDTLADRTIATFACCIGEVDVLLKDSTEMKKSINTNVISGIIFSNTEMVSTGELPHLEWLDLGDDSFVGEVWEPSEGEFCQLKYLSMDALDLEEWRAESTHFPSLEELEINRCDKLKEVPIEIGEIYTLMKLTVYTGHNNSLEESVKKIQEEIEYNGNDSLQVILKRFSDE